MNPAGYNSEEKFLIKIYIYILNLRDYSFKLELNIEPKKIITEKLNCQKI